MPGPGAYSVPPCAPSDSRPSAAYLSKTPRQVPTRIYRCIDVYMCIYMCMICLGRAPIAPPPARRAIRIPRPLTFQRNHERCSCARVVTRAVL